MGPRLHRSRPSAYGPHPGRGQQGPCPRRGRPLRARIRPSTPPLGSVRWATSEVCAVCSTATTGGSQPRPAARCSWRDRDRRIQRIRSVVAASVVFRLLALLVGRRGSALPSVGAGAPSLPAPPGRRRIARYTGARRAPGCWARLSHRCGGPPRIWGGLCRRRVRGCADLGEAPAPMQRSSTKVAPGSAAVRRCRTAPGGQGRVRCERPPNMWARLTHRCTCRPDDRRGALPRRVTDRGHPGGDADRRRVTRSACAPAPTPTNSARQRWRTA